MHARLCKFLLCWCLLVTSLFSNAAFAVEWRSLWQTKDQQAKALYNDKDYSELVERRPSGDWAALGHYQSGDFAAASEIWGNKARDESQRSSNLTTLYNNANALVQMEQYQEAINSYDEVLSADPSFADALHNKAIAEKLLALAEQQSEQQQNQSQDGESKDGESQDAQEGEQQEQENGENTEQNQQGNEQSGNGESDKNAESGKQNQNADQNEDADNQQQEAQSAEEVEQERAKAEQALAAETDAAQSPTEQMNANAVAGTEPVPLSEREQANEQLLRQISDDPAGLLQRKLLQRHETDFPEVGNSVQPW